MTVAPLRDFAIVAIAQHATRTLKRRAGADFRVPTDEELDALAAYQLALGPAGGLRPQVPRAEKRPGEHRQDAVPRHRQHRRARAQELQCVPLQRGRDHRNRLQFGRSRASRRGSMAIRAASTWPRQSTSTKRHWPCRLHLPRDGGFGILPTPLGGFGNFAQFRRARPGRGVQLTARWWRRPTRLRSSTTTPSRTWNPRWRSMARRPLKIASPASAARTGWSS